MCLKPATEAERIKLVDLLHRTLFYHSLDDAYLLQKLCEIVESDQNLNKFHEIAITAGQREHYHDATQRDSVLDSSNSVEVNKVENKSSWQPRGHGSTAGGRPGTAGPGGGASAAAATATTGDDRAPSKTHHR